MKYAITTQLRKRNRETRIKTDKEKQVRSKKENKETTKEIQ